MAEITKEDFEEEKRQRIVLEEVIQEMEKEIFS